MSLSALTARLTAARTVAVVPNNPVDSVLDNFYTLLTSNSPYTDGTTRTVGYYGDPTADPPISGLHVAGSASPALTRGTGTAWTWSKEVIGGKTVAIIGAPPTSASEFCQKTRIVIAGDSSGTSPKRASIGGVTDGNVGANTVWFGLVKNVEAGAIYNGWSNNLPWANCLFAGYTRWGNKTDTYNSTSGFHTARVLETQETCWFQLRLSDSNGSSIFGAMAGGAIDPETGDPADAEEDGRIYLVSHVGSGTMIEAWLRDTNQWGMMLFESSSDGQAHSYSYTPGTNSVVNCSRHFNSNVGTLNLVTRSGKFPRVGPFTMGNINNWAGRLREVQVVRDGPTQQAFTSNGGATINGYTFAHHPSNSGDCILLQY